MAKDYKHRALNQNPDYHKRHSPQEAASSLGLIKWMLITAIIIGFVVFLVYLKSPAVQQAASQKENDQPPSVASVSKSPQVDGKRQADAFEETKEQKPPAPQFDFYTILPKKEVVVPEHEIKTRTREERIGKIKKANYVIQVGSSQNAQEADRLKAKLALMGIESKIQKAKVESAIWFRVKIGPYSQMESVNILMSRLQENGMKPVITEVGE